MPNACSRNPPRMRMISLSNWILRLQSRCGSEALSPHRKTPKSWVRLASKLLAPLSTPTCSPGGHSPLSLRLMYVASGQLLRQQRPKRRRSLRKLSPRKRSLRLPLPLLLLLSMLTILSPPLSSPRVMRLESLRPRRYLK